MTIFKNEESYCIDTNILVYATDNASPFFSDCKALIIKGFAKELPLCLTPQILLEYFSVVTSPKRTLNPLKPQYAINAIKTYLEAEEILKLYPNKKTFLELLLLTEKYKVKGANIFDLQIVATMISNEIKKIYTYDKKHFSKFDEIEILVP
ncbi:MAG: type II toxin-antitoxin system VapC family toxin [Candidatus Magnetoovum sp. WYHC-5]|nr:type II toxin-antitoxin system VapC family toxin [Candidatus Magnetoovum sp. WYHC-5]